MAEKRGEKRELIWEYLFCEIVSAAVCLRSSVFKRYLRSRCGNCKIFICNFMYCVFVIGAEKQSKTRLVENISKFFASSAKRLDGGKFLAILMRAQNDIEFVSE